MSQDYVTLNVIFVNIVPLTFYYMNIFEIPPPLDDITFLFFPLARYHHNQRSITISSLKYLNFKFFAF